MRDILTILAAIVIVLLTLALGVPYFVNWSDHRALIEERLAKALGIPIEIAGPIDVRLLPTPTLSIQRFTAGGSELRLSGDAARFELSLVPLLRGEFQILQADLDSPQLSAKVTKGSAVALPEIPAARGEKVQLSRLIIRKGSIAVADPSGSPHTQLSGLSFDGSADTLFGPFKGQGEFTRAGERIAYRFSTGIADADRMRLKLVLDMQGVVSRADLDGTVIARDVNGMRRVGLEGNAVFGGRLGNGSIPWRASATGTIDADALHAANLEIRLGDDEIALTASGEAEARFGDSGDARIELTSRQLDLDRFQNKFDLAGLLRSASASDAIPPLPVAIDWRAETMTLAGDTITETTASMGLHPNRPLNVSMAATLPARSRFSFQGAMERGTAPGFSGRVEFLSRDPERLAGWLTPLLPDMADNLRAIPFKSVDVAGQAGISAAGFLLRDAKAKFDRSTFAGTISYTRALGAERARLFADLTSPALDIETLPNLSGSAKGAANLDMSLALDAKAVKIGGLAATPVDAGRIRTKLVRGAAETRLERLSVAGLGGANIEASGIWRDGGGKIDAKLDATQLRDLADLMARVAPGPAAAFVQSRVGALSPAHLRIQGESDPGRPSLFGINLLSIEGNLAATRGSMRIAEAQDDPQTSEATILLESPEAATLARQIGFGVLPLRGIGQGRIAATARGRLNAPWTGFFSASLAGATANLDGSAQFDDGQPTLAGKLKLSSTDAGPLLQLLALTPADLTLRLPVDVAGRLDWSPNGWRLSELSGTVAGNGVAGQLARAADNAAIGGSLSLDRIPIGALARTVLGPEQPVRAGANWSEASFAHPLADPPRIELDLKGARLDISDALTGSRASLHLTMAPGALALDHLSMGLAGGRLDGNVALRREDNNVALSGRLAFDRLAVDKPAAAAVITGTLEFATSGKSEAALAAGLAGAGEIGLSSLRVNGLDPSALPRVIALAEDEKISVEPKEVEAALARELDRAPFRGETEVYFDASLAGGVLKLSPRSAYTQTSTRTNMQAAFDARNSALNVQADIVASAPPRGWMGPPPQISVTWSRLLSQPVRRIDSSTLVAALAARAAQREADRIQSLEFDIKERAFFNRRLKWDRARQEEREREAAEQARLEQERIDQERRAAAEAEAARRRAAAEAARKAAEAEAARRRAESTPPVPADNPFLRAQPTPAPGLIAPRFRAPAADQDPSAAGRY